MQVTDKGGRYPGWEPGIELRDDWLGLVVEDIIDPDREIVDPHHHLWRHGTAENPAVYEMEALRRDTEAGHNVVQTMFIECRSYWDQDAPDHLKSIGETRTVAEMASSVPLDRAQIAGIIGQTELVLDPTLLNEALDAHQEAGKGLFKGIRNSGARDPEPQHLAIPGRGVPNQYGNPDFVRGAAILGERGLTLDSWHYHHQHQEFLDLARAVPHTTLILDHFGTPLGVGRFEGKRDDIFAAWKDHMSELAECPNVMAKLGGLCMPDNGFGYRHRDLPPSSDEIVETQGKWYAHMLDAFGPNRCMFESNFPVDRTAVSYQVIWNAFKKMAADLDETAKEALFSGTARRVYSLPPA
ncbi:amidohydrolase family protein [Sulfitobacter sp.]|jgi:predicted TIM-barrel fold metal-dependent hydrolase|uniref:amidohydrolase family protein n=1 Tax=Sulfitobacter sp. TaxID=1903071 RepID=UPI00268C04D9|tara:strand:+ start:2033 stop:3094 length:1062 start_codon:yes stop_codon:yes gene_type:complete